MFRENIISNVWIIFSCQQAVRVSGWRKSTEDLRQLSLIYTFLLGLCLALSSTHYCWALILTVPQPSLSPPVTDGRRADLSNLALRRLLWSPGRPGQSDDLVIIWDIPVLIRPGSSHIIQHNHRPSVWYISVVRTNCTFLTLQLNITPDCGLETGKVLMTKRL